MAKRVLVGIILIALSARPALGQQRFDPFAPGARNAPAARAQGIISSVEFVDAPITTVFKMISDLTGWSIIMSPEVSKTPPRINIWIKDLTPAEVLDQVSTLGSLIAERKGTIVQVMSFEEYANIRGLEKRVIQLKHASAKDVAAALRPFAEKTEQARIFADEPGGRVVLLVPSPRLESLEKLVTALDLPIPFEQETVKIIPLKFLESSRIAPTLEQFAGKTSVTSVTGRGPLAPSSQPADVVMGERWNVQFMVESKLNVVVLRGSAVAVTKAEQLIRDLDIQPMVSVVPYDLKHVSAKDAFLALNEIVKKDFEGAGAVVSRLRIAPSEQANRLVVEGSPLDHQRISRIIEALDKPVAETSLASYELRNTDCQSAFAVLGELLAKELGTNAADGRIQMAVSQQNSRIVCIASPQDQARVAELIGEIDKPASPGTGGLRVYRLQNTSAKQVAGVLQDLLEEQRPTVSQVGPRLPSYTSQSGVRPVSPPAGGGSVAPVPGLMPSGGPGGGLEGGGNLRLAELSRGTPVGGPAGPPPTGSGSQGSPEAAPHEIPPRVIQADEINAVIVRASAAEQDRIARIVQELDRPRDQVTLEVTMVTVRADRGFDLGIELKGAYLGDHSTQAVGFTNFGVGAVDPTGKGFGLAIPPRFGGNFAVFVSDDFSLVLNALETIGQIRITSAPKILVEDNSEAIISQVIQEPYESSSQNDNTTVTSFGGFVDAGTSLRVAPQISEQNWLRLQYEISQSSFGNRTAAQQASNLPPPRRENAVTGTVRIPAEHMVVLGGLVGTRQDDTVSQVPLVGDWPVLGEFFKDRSKSKTTETLFIFIRPIIHRDPTFRDLLYLSKQDIAKAKLPQQDCPDNPLKMFLPDLDVERAVNP